MSENIELNPCPFCGSKDIRYSDKAVRIDFKRKRHVAMYCNNCHVYGSRTIVYEAENYPFKAIDGYRIAAVAWNTRTPDIVRCGGCANWIPNGEYSYDINWKQQVYGECKITSFHVKENHFCAFGRRKEAGK